MIEDNMVFENIDRNKIDWQTFRSWACPTFHEMTNEEIKKHFNKIFPI